MENREERDIDTCMPYGEVYEPPILEEVGGFAALTHADSTGSVVDGAGYYPR
jgi:hypothetical protein